MPNKYDFALEKRLKELNPDLSKRYASCMSLFENMLKKYIVQFPDFTDHTLLHSMNVANYSNLLLGKDVNKLNEDEIYCYLMAVAVHDVGMGVSESNFKEFKDFYNIQKFMAENPFMPHSSIIRDFHNDLSEAFVHKYYQILDIPDETYANAIGLIAKGHRKTNLFDETQYPNDFKVSSGNIIHLPSLSALIRLADEMDTCSDRNPDIIYGNYLNEKHSDYSRIHNKKHRSLEHYEIDSDEIELFSNNKYPEVYSFILDTVNDIYKKLNYARDVTLKYGPFEIRQTKLILHYEGNNDLVAITRN